MSSNAYCRMPTLFDEKIVFVSENDLWQVLVSGGIALRLTTSQGAISNPKFSHNGKWIAFNATEEGSSDVYCMPSDGGSIKRLTYLGSNNRVCGWSLDDEYIILSTSAKSPNRIRKLFKVPLKGGEVVEILVGYGFHIDYHEKGYCVIGRSTDDNARWKHYRGGTAGNIIIDNTGNGEFKPLITLNGNVVLPYFVGEKVIFLSDHEGTSNLYSVALDGSNLHKLTNHENYYARFLSVFKNQAIYQAGGDIYLLNLTDSKSSPQKVSITLPSMRVQKSRKYVNASNYLEDYHISRNFTNLLTVIRGKVYHFGFWEGGVDQLGIAQGVRYNNAVPLSNDQVALFSDESGECRLELYSLKEKIKKETLPLDIGIPFYSKASPDGKLIAMTNNRYEIVVVNIHEKSKKIIVKDVFLPTNMSIEEKIEPINFFDWSPDSKWITYSKQVNSYCSSIFLYSIEQNKEFQISPTEFFDYKPNFDPKGRYIYFISLREFNSYEDRQFFRHVFSKSSRICAINLSKDLETPFILKPEKFSEKNAQQNSQNENENITDIPVKIDIEDIQRRISLVPLEESIYLDVQASNDSLYYLTRPVLKISELVQDPNNPIQTLKCFNIITLEDDVIEDKVTSFKLGADKTTLVLRSGKNLKVISSSQGNQKKDTKEASGNQKQYNRKSGWIDTERIKVLVEPEKEWKQMFNETWRLMKEHYWDPSLLINWQSVHDKYEPLLSKVSTREEFSDLIWEMISETGTSHSYEMGGDYRKGPNYKQGFLGGEFAYDQTEGGYVIKKIFEGDNWDPEICSPLDRPGINIQKGDVLLSINGQVGNSLMPIGELLLNQGGQNVNIMVKNHQTNVIKELFVKTLVSEMELRYRVWVKEKRKLVSDLSQNRLGYIHIPNMSVKGVTEFYRAIKNEISKDGLIIDVRFNGGGNTSELFLEMLISAQKATGYMKTRYSDNFGRYFMYSTEGPQVALANEFTGSDGDIFSHNFKLLQLGTLIGKRTWGGVVGIWDKFRLVDGSLVTQPEFAFWFKDIEWGVENHGVDPDIEIDYFPQDYVKGFDPQLTKAVEIAMDKLKEIHPKKPQKKVKN